MSDVPYYKPPQEGPIFADEAGDITDEFSAFLAASDRDVSDAVARQNIADKTDASFKLWLELKLRDLGVSPPDSK